MTIYLLLLISISLVFIIQFIFGPRQRLPPGPNSLHVLTYLSHLIHKPHIALQKLSHIYGPLISFKLGDQLLVVTSSPDVAKELLQTHDRVFSGRHLPTIYHNLPGNMHSSIILSPERDDSWKKLRSIAQNYIFSTMVVESNALIRKEKVTEVVDNLRIKQGEVNVEELMFAALSNIVSSVLTWRNLFDIGGEGGSERRVKMEVMNAVIEKTLTLGLVDYLSILKGLDFWSKEKAMDIHRMIKLMLWGDIIRTRRSARRAEDHGSSDRDFLDMVVDDATFSDDQIDNLLLVSSFRIFYLK